MPLPPYRPCLHTYIAPVYAEKHLLLLLCKFLIFPGNQDALFVVYRIIRLFPLFKIVGVFIGDDGRMLFAELKVLVFDDTGIRSFAIGKENIYSYRTERRDLYGGYQ